MTDESTDIATEKSTCIVVRYFDENQARVISAFYDLCNVFKSGVECANAAIIYENIVESLKKITFHFQI